MKYLFFFLIFVVFSSARLFGWSAAGHEMGGAIAYWYLKAHHPQAIPKVVAVLEKHPWYDTSWKPRLKTLPPENREINLFMFASTFPDEARRTTFGNGEKSKWHYINYPYNLTREPDPEMVEPNAELKLKELISNFAAKKDEKQKALDLCWIFHILEDLHQPLHTTAMLDALHKTGDKGGNDTYFSFTEEGKPIRLHSFWDGLIKGKPEDIPATAKLWLELPKYQKDSLPELSENPDIHNWVLKESFTLAKTVAYQNGTINGVEHSTTVVPMSYKTEALAVAEKRVVLSGIRLGMQLGALFGE